jgi:CBS domain containing-hemolysin-like protein
VEQLARDGSRGAAGVLTALRSLSFQLSGAQLGITVTSLLVGFIVESTVGRALRPLVEAIFPGTTSLEVSIGLALVIVTAAQMILSELVPKNLAISRPLALAIRVAPLLRAANTLFAPVIKFLNASANWTVRRFGIEPREELIGVPTMQELRRLIYSSRQEGVLPEEEFSLLTRSINFASKSADDALVPRVDIVALSLDDTLADMAERALATGHSRFPVMGEGGLDDIVGVALIKDGYRFPPEDRAKTPVADIMEEPLLVPESQRLETLMSAMRRDRKHLAIVVDEYGGTAGIITLEDLLEEIVGEIDDEYDPDSDRPNLTSPTRGIYVLSGMLRPDEVFDAAGFEIPGSDDYETLAGFLLSLFARIPDQGDHASFGGWEFKVVEMDDKRIAQVLLVAPSQMEDVGR